MPAQADRVLQASRTDLTGGLWFNGVTTNIPIPNWQTFNFTGRKPWSLVGIIRPTTDKGGTPSAFVYYIDANNYINHYLSSLRIAIVRRISGTNIGIWPSGNHMNKNVFSVVTYNGTTMRLVNRADTWTDNSTTDTRDFPSSNPSVFRVGGYALFQGQIIYYAIYNKTLTDSEIDQIFYKRQFPTEGLNLLYDFTEGQGTTVYDKSGKGNHGTIVGNTRWAVPIAHRVLACAR